jgi:hypothetical protein
VLISPVFQCAELVSLPVLSCPVLSCPLLSTQVLVRGVGA